MRVIKTTATRTCVVCERTLLQGEHALRYSPDGSGYVDVCPLCTDAAVDHGWVKEGVSASPMLQVPWVSAIRLRSGPHDSARRAALTSRSLMPRGTGVPGAV